MYQRKLRLLEVASSMSTKAAEKCALIVVDMQNYFVADGFAGRVPVARECVPQINEAAKALRAVGGTVVWVQTTAVGALLHDPSLDGARRVLRA